MIRKPNFKLNWKYALGEVLLIFIGISLAIGFQNWNDQRKDLQKVNSYLATISNNLRKDSTEIAGLIKTIEAKQETSQLYLEAVKAEKPNIRAFLAGINQVQEDYLNIDNTGFQALLSSGFLSNIQGTLIEKALFEYYSLYDEVRENEISMNEFIESQERVFLNASKSANFMILVSDIFLQNREPQLTREEEKLLEEVFDNPALVSIKIGTGLYSRYYQPLMRKGDELRKLIDQRLTK